MGVAITPSAEYPREPPFHPSQPYPEYPFPGALAGEENAAYELVRRAFRNLGLDEGRFGSSEWDPLGSIVEPGNTVLVKPNMVLDAHPAGGDVLCLITHGAVVRAVLDYVALALKGHGRIIVADSPIQTTDFNACAARSGVRAVVDWYRTAASVEVSLLDLRQVVSKKDERGHILGWQEVPGDPAGYVTFDLGTDSLLRPLEQQAGRFRVSNYRPSETQQYHGPGTHRYVIARSVLDADVILDLPKMKTHSKVGVTLGLKNFVGTVGRKQCLAHHREGGARASGDEYPGRNPLKALSVRLEQVIDGCASRPLRRALELAYRVNERLVKMAGGDPIRDGGWYGNDTVWRMTLDLVRIAMYGRADGTLADTPQRRILTVIDGIIAGEGEGPLAARPKRAGRIVASPSPVLADVAAAGLMGFDYNRIPLLREALRTGPRPLCDQPVEGAVTSVDGEQLPVASLGSSSHRLDFEPPEGWKGHIELGK